MVGNLKWKRKKEMERYSLFSYQFESMVAKFSILIIVSCFISSFSGKNNAPVYKPIAEKGLFDSDEILSITLKGNIRGLLNDRGETPTYHPVTLSYKNKDRSEVNIPVKMKARG